MLDNKKNTHSICEACWDKLKPAITIFRLGTISHETCCFCGKQNKDGIYVRNDDDVSLVRHRRIACQRSHQQ